MKLLYLGAVIDQLDLPQVAWAELAARHGQMVELKYKHKFVPVPVKNPTTIDPFDDSHLYLGLSSTRGQLAVCPELERWVGKKLSEEYLAIKERRKAIESPEGWRGQGEMSTPPSAEQPGGGGHHQGKSTGGAAGRPDRELLPCPLPF